MRTGAAVANEKAVSRARVAQEPDAPTCRTTAAYTPAKHKCTIAGARVVPEIDIAAEESGERTSDCEEGAASRRGTVEKLDRPLVARGIHRSDEFLRDPGIIYDAPPLMVSSVPTPVLIAKALAPELNAMLFTSVLVESETSVVLETSKVAVSDGPFGTVAGVQLAAVFQLPLAR